MAGFGHRRRALLIALATCWLCRSSGFMASSRWHGQLAKLRILNAPNSFANHLRSSRARVLLPCSLRRACPVSVRMGKEEAQDAESFPSMKTVEYYSDEGNMEDATEARSLGRVEEIGLFPLGLVLNPGATLPLHIFEMRYRQLFNSAWDGNQKMGIVMYDKEKNKWARVGTSARVVRFQPLPDGRILTVNEGEERFRVLKVTRAGSSKDYIKALVEYLDDEATEPEALSALETEVWESLQNVLSLSNALYGKTLDLKDSIKKLAPKAADVDLESSAAEGDAEAADAKPDAEAAATEGAEESKDKDGGKRTELRGTAEGVVRVEVGADKELTEQERQRLFSFAVSQVLDMPLEDQQLMLQSTVTEERLQKQVGLLSQARQYLAAQVALKNAFGKSVE